jgi:hypothetical protein
MPNIAQISLKLVSQVAKFQFYSLPRRRGTDLDSSRNDEQYLRPTKMTMAATAATPKRIGRLTG